MKTPQVKPSWDTGIYIGNGVVAKPKTQTTFKALPIGATFHFRNTASPTFFDDCKKVSTRCYVSADQSDLPKMQVSTTSVGVTPILKNLK